MAKIPSAGGTPANASGWVKIADITAPIGVVSDKVFRDPPNNTILETCTTSDLNIDVEVVAAYPQVTVNGTPAILTEAADQGHYSGTVNITLPGAGDVMVVLETPEGGTSIFDNATVAYDPAPVLLTLSFTGGYPGAQTELKAGDVFQLTGTKARHRAQSPRTNSPPRRRSP